MAQRLGGLKVLKDLTGNLSEVVVIVGVQQVHLGLLLWRQACQHAVEDVVVPLTVVLQSTTIR